ncbi:lambda B RNA-dependent RNA polymerase [Chatham orthoreovirus]|nr:lambda B RNA-dependent RNA polymerase [Chatham orthoreovirus]
MHVKGLEVEIARLSEALSGLTPLTNEIFESAAKAISQKNRSYVYELLDQIDFTVDIPISSSIFHPPPHDEFYYIDGVNRVRRKQIIDKDDVFVPNCRLNDLLVPMERLPNYGQLNPIIYDNAKDGQPSARKAVTFYNTAVSQARQVKAPLESFLLPLIASHCYDLSDDPCGLDTSQPPPLHSNLALYVLHRVAKTLTDGFSDRSPWLLLDSSVAWIMSPLMSAAIPPLMTDLTNLAIYRQICGIPDELMFCAVRMFLLAAESGSYSHFILRTKALFPQNSLHNMFRSLSGGMVPVIEWVAPRSNYQFILQGSRQVTSNDVNASPDNTDTAETLGRENGCLDIVKRVRTLTAKFTVSNHDAMTYVRDAMACTSGIYITRAPTETVLKEYTQAPEIKVPIPISDWSSPVGSLRYLNESCQLPAKYLWRTWRRAAAAVADNPNTWDPLTQAIMRSQYVTSRGGSGAALRDALKAAEVELPTYPGVSIKVATKIYQAAQTADVPFEKLSRAVNAPLSMGLRNQVQRRPRTIMPMNVVQQQVSAVHTLAADYINYHMNLSTTSGSAVIEKVVPLGMYASSPPAQAVNIDIKACDASITYAYFLSTIVGALHDGASGRRPTSAFMGVPPSVLSVVDRAGVTATVPISGMQVMAQWLAKLYQRGFEYQVTDTFSPGNVFTHHTTTFPSGSTATSTEHTANNSTMMDCFLRDWIPSSGCSDNLRKFAHSLSIRNNYVCQGDDGLLIVDGLVTGRVDGAIIAEFVEELRKYGKSFGWNYDIEFTGNAEYLKLYFLNGCRIPNISRHPICGKERASGDKLEMWPSTIDIFLGIYINGIHDALPWRRWLRFCWMLAASYSRKLVKHSDRDHIIQYPMWSFVYWGMPPVSAFGSDPWIFSPMMPPGDHGMYSLLTLLRSNIMNVADSSESEGIFGHVDHVSLFNRERLFQGYYMAQLPRQPVRSNRRDDPDAVNRFIFALEQYLYNSPELKARVRTGKDRWLKLVGRLDKSPPSLDDVARKWFKGAQEADLPTFSEIEDMDNKILAASSHTYQGFSKLLNAYLNVTWALTEPIEVALDPRTPICAGVNPSNSDPFLKYYSLGPMMQSTKKYFNNTLFVHRTVSGLDVDAIDKSLLRLRALGAGTELMIAQLMMVGLSESDAATMAAKVRTADINAVQLARVVNLSVPDAWMTLNFDALFRFVVNLVPKDVRTLTTDIPAGNAWVRAILQFLGAGVTMTAVGPVRRVQITGVKCGMSSFIRQFRRWMRAEAS